MKVKYLGAVLVTVSSVLIFTGCHSNINNYDTTKVSLSDRQFILKVVKSEEEKTKGLSGIKNLPSNEGMLFIFDQPSYLQFWMKETLIPLQILFLNNCQIVDLQEMAVEPDPANPQKKYISKSLADQAIELNKGTLSDDILEEKVLELCNFQKETG